MKRYSFSLKAKIMMTVLLLVTVAAVIAYKEYNRKPTDLATLSPDVKIGADSLLAAYAENEEAANRKYLGKVIEVTGIVSDGSTKKNILLGLIPDSKVSCLLDSTNALKSHTVKAGDTLRLRGVCTGFLLDVELNRCVVLD